MKKDLLIPIFVFGFVLFIYILTGPFPKTPYNYFVRLSSAFLHGRLYLTRNPSYLNELIPIGGKYYVVYPPMPAILMMPLVLLFGENFSQTLFAQLIGAINVALVYILFKKLNYKKASSLLLALTLGFGTNHWYLASVGSAWYLAHIVCIFFLLLSLIEFYTTKGMFLAGLFLGAAYWSRLPIILAAIFFILNIGFRKYGFMKKTKQVILFIFGVFIFVLANAIYNFLRFGFWGDIAYMLIPNVLNEPWFNKGIFHYSYILGNLKFFLFKMPTVTNKFPYIIFSLQGMAFWLTTPVSLLVLKSSFKNKYNLISLLTFLIGLILVLSHGTTGCSQFGFRYIIDFFPFLLLLLANVIKKKISTIFYILFFISVLINFSGVLWINKFGWFSL